MGSVSRAGIGAAIGLAFAAAFVVAQDSGVPEKLLGTRDGQYLLFDLQDSLEAELWDELTGSAVPSSGDVLVVDSVAQQGRVTLIAESKQKIVAGGVAGLRQVPDPSSADLGNVVTVVQGATRDAPHVYAWQAPTGGGGSTPLSNDDPKNLGPKAPGTSTRASRGDHVHAIPVNMATTAALQRVSDAAAAHRQVPVFGRANNGQVLAVRVVNNVASTDWAVVRDVSDPGPATNGQVLTVTGSDSFGWANAPAAVRPVPDAAHVADGHVLTADGGGYEWAAPSGGGSEGGAGAWVDVASATWTGATTGFYSEVQATLLTGQTTATVRAASRARRDWRAQVYSYTTSSGAPSNQSWNGTAYLGSQIYTVPETGNYSYFLQGAFAYNTGGDNDGIVRMSVNQDGIKLRGRLGAVGNAGTVAMVLQMFKPGGGGGGGSATPLSDGIPKPLSGGAGSSGTGTAASRGDHIHPASLSNAAPRAAGTAAPGTSGDWSRADHVHPDSLSDAKPNSLAATALAGSAKEASRGDHVHSNSGIRQVPAYQNVPSALGYNVNYVLGFSLCESSSPGSNNLTCNLGWQKPVRWQRQLVGSSAPTDFSGTGSFTIKESTYALQAFMQNTLTAFQKFEIYLKFTKSGQEFHYLINLAGLPPGEAQVTETATYYSENSNNSLTGNTQWARLEVGAATHTVTYHLNSQGESKVEARIYGYR